MTQRTRRARFVRIGALVNFLLSVGLVAAFIIPAASAAPAVDVDGWEFQNPACNGVIGLSSGNFVPGPGVPLMGSGSFEFTVDDANGFPQLRQRGFGGARLADLTTLSYSTYVNAGGVQPLAPYLLLDVDTNGDGVADDQLVFQPGAQGVAINGFDWQTWDALSGTWWSMNGLAGMGQSSGGKTLANYLASYPDAQIVNTDSRGGFRIAAGCIGGDWTGFDGSVDAVTIGVAGANTTYDFEPSGVVVTPPPSGIEQPQVPVFTSLAPAPFTTVLPGTVTLTASVQSDTAITAVTMKVGSLSLGVALSGLDPEDQTATATAVLPAGVYTATATATNAGGYSFTAQWDFVVSSNLGDTEWFTAGGAPKAAPINATITSLVQAFRWHLWAESWDGQAHPDMPTHGTVVTQAAPLGTWVNGTTFDEAATDATLTSLVQAFRWHFWGISWDGKAHPEMPTHASVVLSPQSISPWFNADGTPIRTNVEATLRSLVEAFRWHFWGYSWDGKQHFADMPTHAPR